MAERPSSTWSPSPVFGRKRSTKSRTAMVEMEFIIANREEIIAANSAPSTSPRTPPGQRLLKSHTKVDFDCWSLKPGSQAKAITPGSAKRNTGVSFKSTANMAPHRA